MIKSPIDRIIEWRKSNPQWNEKRLDGLRNSKKAKIAAAKVSRNPHFIKKRIASMLKNPNVMKGQNHPCAKEWVLKSPVGIVYSFKNLDKFIRENSDLFLPGDIAWKKANYNYHCNAYKALSSLRTRGGSWKGWTWGMTFIIDNPNNV